MGKKLNKVVEAIEKIYGKGAIMKMDQDRITGPIEVIPSGCIGLDLALGVGGYPRGRIIEIYGPESSGKTTLCLQLIAEAQKLGGDCGFIDAEHALDMFYGKALGVNLSKLYLSQPDNGEQALDILEKLIDSGEMSVIIIDSVAALTPKAEIDGDMGDSKMGLQARLMSQAMRKLAGKIHKSGTIVVFTNQLRDKIGVMFGSLETTTGGNALKFYASVRLDIRKQAKIGGDNENIGNRVKIKVVKNKVAPPFKTAECDLIFGKGIERTREVLDYGVEHQVIKKSGSWFSYKETKLGQGREGVIELLNSSVELLKEIESEVLLVLGLIEE